VNRRLLLCGLMAVVVVGTWFAWRAFMAIPICEIVNSPREFEGRQVTIAGEVTGRFGVLSFNAFTVADETGELRILTRRMPPSEGTRVRVRGSVRSGLVLGNWQQVMLIEQK